MSTLRDALFRIEPTRGLVSYTEDVKPYHTKILDVLIEYVYEERIDATLTEKWRWEIHWDERWDNDRDADWLASRKAPHVTYSCGYGIVWDQSNTADANPPVEIVDISPASHQILSITPTNGATHGYFTMAGKVAGDFPAGSVFRVTDSSYSNSASTVPADIIEFTVYGTPVYANGKTRVSVTETLLPVVSPTLGNAYARVDAFDSALTPPANSFLVTTPTPNQYHFMVIDKNSNRLAIADRVTIVGVNPTAHQWTVSGNKVDDIAVGMKIHVTNNNINANGMYTVSARTLSGANTVITVTEPIFSTATNTGLLAFPLRPADTYTIAGVNPGSRQWTVVGNHLTGIIANQELVITGNNVGDGKYTVQSVLVVGGNTVITVKNTIPVTATASGTLTIERLPGWTSGIQIKLSGAGVQPAPMATAGTYYFIPTPTPGQFNIGYKRYPTTFKDIVDITTLGVGDIKISRGELYYPGAVIQVNHTYTTGNRGSYYVKNTVPEGLSTRVFVMQHINSPNGGTGTIAGTMHLGGTGYDEPSYCPLASAPSLYTDTFIHEHLQFTTIMVERDSITAQAEEYHQNVGWGVSAYSRGIAGPYGSNDFVDVPNRFAMTTGNPTMDGAHVLLPTGFDTQLWSLGGMCESYTDVQNFYNRTLP